MSPQHLDALQVANQRRFARSALRGRITEAGGTGHERRLPHMRGAAMLEAAHELEPRPECLHTMAAFAFLRWSCRPLEARSIMAAADIHNELRTLGELTDRQTTAIVQALRYRASLLGADEQAAA